MARFEIIKKDINGKTSSYNVTCDGVEDSGTLMNLYFSEVNQAIERKKGEAIIAVTKHMTYFERQQAVKDHAAQSGWNFTIGNPSY